MSQCSSGSNPTDESAAIGAGQRIRQLESQVAELQRLREEMVENEQRFRAFAEASFEGVAIVENGRIVDANPWFSRMFGYALEEIHGREVVTLVAPEDRELVAEKIRANDLRSYEHRALCKDGSIIDVEVCGRPALYKGRPCRITALRDISDRKRFDNALRESESRFRELVEGIREIFWLEKPNGEEMLYVSPAFEALSGLRVKDALADPTLWKNMVHPEDRPRVHEAVKRLYATGRMNLEYRVIRPDGEVRRVYDRGWAIRDENGEVTRLAGVAEDVTERREAEEARRRLEARVRHAQKLESLGVLAGGIAHDFNNLLVAIVGNADLALWDLADDAAARTSVVEIKNAAARAADLANQMLAYSGKGRAVVAPVDLNDLIAEMGRLLTAAISKTIEVEYELAPDIPAIEADGTQLRQVVMNLITNASEAIGDAAAGVIAIRTGVVEADRRTLQAAMLGANLPPGSYAFLEVADTGAGMDAETRSKLFEPFFSTKFAGRGLGMSAVLGIVRAHHGAIRIDSEVGRGSVFRVLLPIAVDSSSPTEAPATPEHAPEFRGRGTVLVVDDEAGVRMLTEKVLRRLGLEVLTAADGSEAVEVFAAHADAVSLVLLDLTMPGMNGEEAFEQIRRLRPETPVFLCSGFAEEQTTRRFAGRGLAGFLHKPFGVNELLEKIAPWLNEDDHE